MDLYHTHSAIEQGDLIDMWASFGLKMLTTRQPIEKVQYKLPLSWLSGAADRYVITSARRLLSTSRFWGDFLHRATDCSSSNSAVQALHSMACDSSSVRLDR